MNYKKIYYDLCEYCKSTPIKERLYKRNKTDFRLNLDEDKIYDVECVAIESYDRKKEQMGWQALEFYILG